MKKTIIRIVNCVLVLSIICSLISLPVGAQHVTELNATEVDAAETLVPQGVSQSRSAITFTCGQKQTGSFGMYPETFEYSVSLPANQGVVFSAWGAGEVTATVQSLTVIAPNGTTTNIPRVNNTTNFYGVVNTTVAGIYTIRVYGALGTYYVNCVSGYKQTSNTNSTYNRAAAAQYARQHAKSYNTAYPSWGADCTNYVSQCVYAGGMPKITASSHSNANDSHWYLTNATNYSPSWTGADWFMRHWAKVREYGNYVYNGRAYSVRIYTKDYVLNNKATVGSFISVGDVVHYLSASNSNAYHSTIISVKNSNTDIKFCAHSQNRKDEDFFTYISGVNIGIHEFIVVVKISNN